MSYYHARPCDIEAFRNQTRRGVSSAGREFKVLGHDCDRKQWERVRALWMAKEQ